LNPLEYTIYKRNINLKLIFIPKVHITPYIVPFEKHLLNCILKGKQKYAKWPFKLIPLSLVRVLQQVLNKTKYSTRLLILNNTNLVSKNPGNKHVEDEQQRRWTHSKIH